MTAFDTILVLDFGSQYSHLITRRLRELHVHSELWSCTTTVETFKKLDSRFKGMILSGGPYSVYDREAPHVDPLIFSLGLPILGICYGMQEIAWHFNNGTGVAATDKREYGHAELHILSIPSSTHDTHGNLFDNILPSTSDHVSVWMSHSDKLLELPANFLTIANTSNSPYAAIKHNHQPIWGIQFHPEVTHTPCGLDILRNFAINICQASDNWTMKNFLDNELQRVKSLVGPDDHVIGAVSGGVDSTVAAKLLHMAIGDRFHAVLVDNGLLRWNEASMVHKTLTHDLNINLTLIDASDIFLGKLHGITDPEQKRKIIGNTFIEIFQDTAKSIEKSCAKSARPTAQIKWLLQGTLYPDVIESVSYKGPSATIKTHHNVGGLLDNMHLKLIEPLRELFKDEVRQLGCQLGIPEHLIWRHPFPGPGLAIRIIGKISQEQLDIVRQADKIFIDEINSAGLYRKISQAYASLLPLHAVGVMGDARLYGQIIGLRAVVTTDFMTAEAFAFDPDFLRKVSLRIVNEVSGVCRVFYEYTSKPPATIELE